MSGASSVPFAEHKLKRGERGGLNWRLPLPAKKRATRYVLFDTNFWKSFVHARFAVAMGDPGSLSLFGQRPEHHRLIAEHLTSEFRVRTQGRGRTVDEWKFKADGLDNHWLDCLVGSAVAASMEGASLFGAEVRPVQREAIRLSEIRSARKRRSSKFEDKVPHLWLCQAASRGQSGRPRRCRECGRRVITTERVKR